jgi:hypothetical protein
MVLDTPAMTHTATPAARAWRQFAAGMVLYALAIAAASVAVNVADPSTAVRVGLALAPAAALLWAMSGWLSAVRSFDELGRRVFVEAAAVALGFVLAGAATHGLLAAFAGVPSLNGFVVFAAGAIVFVVASAAAWRRYR